MSDILYYAGIGSMETPPQFMERMKLLSARLAKLGFVLRSGAAPGADTAFEDGCKSVNGEMEIYLPWRGFNGNSSSLFNPSNEAAEIASMTHPGWAHCSQAAKKLHARNVHQVMGQDLNTPSAFVVCWTRDGCEHGSKRSQRTGGTGQAISIASGQGLSIYNLFNNDAEMRLERHIRRLLGVGYVRVVNVRPDMDPDNKPEEDEVIIPVHRDNPIFGNKHVLKNKDDPEERKKVIDSFRSDLDRDIMSGGPMSQEIEDIAQRVVAGDKVCLSCFCKPRECHGDVIAGAINLAVTRILNPKQDPEPPRKKVFKF